MRESLSHCSNLNLQCVCYFTVNLLHWKWGIIPFWEWLNTHFNLPVTIFSNLNNAIRCAIWNHLHSFKKVKNTHGRVLLLVKLQALHKSNTPPWVFFTIFKLCKWYQIAQNITYLISKLQHWTEAASSIERKIWGAETLYTTEQSNT